MNARITRASLSRMSATSSSGDVTFAGVNATRFRKEPLGLVGRAELAQLQVGAITLLGSPAFIIGGIKCGVGLTA